MGCPIWNMTLAQSTAASAIVFCSPRGLCLCLRVIDPHIGSRAEKEQLTRCKSGCVPSLPSRCVNNNPKSLWLKAVALCLSQDSSYEDGV